MSTTFLRLCFIFAFLTLPATACLAQDDDADPAAADPSESLVQEWDRLIYVPFQELKDVFNNQKSSAVIPYAEYIELMKVYLERRSHQGDSPDAMISKADYQATVEADVVRITAKLQIDLVEEDGWKQLALPFGNCAIGAVESDDDDCLLKGKGNGKYDLWLKGSGTKTVTLKLLTAVTRSPEHQSFAIQCPATAIGSLQVKIPKADQQISVLPLQILLPESDVDDNTAAEADDQGSAEATVVNASLASTNRFEVRWNPKASSKPVMDLLTSVQNTTNVKIEPGLIQTSTKLSYEVLRGELTEASVLVPKNARVIDVAATVGQIRSWDIEAGDAQQTHQTLKLDLLNPISDRFEVTVEIEQDLEGEAASLLGKSSDGIVHGIHAENIIRETGILTVTTDSTLTTTVQDMSGVKRTRQTKNSSALDQQSWSFTGQTGQLILKVSPVKPRLLAQQTANVIFDDDQIRLTSRITFTVERAGVFQLKIQYPEDLKINSVRADGMTEFQLDKTAGTLTLSLAQKRIGKIAVDIQAHRPFDSTVALDKVDIPFLEAAGVEREDGQVRILAPPFLDIITIDESVKGLFPHQEASSKASGRAIVVSAWKYSQKPTALSVRTSPRSAQVSSTVATTAKIEPNMVAMNSVITFNVKNAGIDTFRISVPEAVADDVRFRTVNGRQSIQQRNQGDPSDGLVTWTLVLQNEVIGAVPFLVDWEVPISTVVDDPATESATEANVPSQEESQQTFLTIALPEVLAPFEDDAAARRDVTMTGVTGELRLLRHDSLSVSATAEEDSMEAIDVRELKLMDSNGYLAFRYFEQPASAKIQITRHEIQEVVKTVIAKAAIEVVTDEQRLANYLCQYEITSSERQRLRVDLPQDAELQAPLLNSARTTFEAADDVEPQTGWQAYYVNISRKSTSDQAFVLTLQFRCPITEEGRYPFQGQGGKQILRIPNLTSADEAVVVQETRLAVYHPKKIALVGDANQWKYSGKVDWNLTSPLMSSTAEEEASDFKNWVSNAAQASDFARQGHVSVYRTLGHQPSIETTWWNRPFLVGIISAAILLIGFILRRTSWENRLAIVVISTLAVGIWSLQDRSETMQFVTAAVPGLAAVAVLWLIGCVTDFGASQTPQSPPTQSPPTQSPPSSPAAPTNNQPDPPGQSPPSTDPVADSQHSDQASSGKTSDTNAPAAVSPSPDVKQMIDDLMGGK